MDIGKRWASVTRRARKRARLVVARISSAWLLAVMAGLLMLLLLVAVRLVALQTSHPPEFASSPCLTRAAPIICARVGAMCSSRGGALSEVTVVSV